MKNNAVASLGLRARILSLAVVPVLGLITVLFVENFAHRRMTAANELYEKQRELIGQTEAVRSSVGLMRIAADRFRAQKDEKSELAFAEAMTKASEVKTMAGLDVGARFQHAIVEKAFQAHVAGFTEYVEVVNRVGRVNSEGLVGAMGFIGLKLKGLVSSVDVELGMWSSVFRETVYEAFMAERDFRVHQTNGYITHFERIGERMDSLLGVVDMAAAAKAELKEGIAGYRNAFTEWSDAVQHAETVYNRFAANHVILLQEIEKLSALLDARSDANRKEQASIGAMQRWWVIGALVAVVALSVALALWIGVGLSRQLGRLSAAMRQLATDDVTTVIPRVNRKDEIGVMSEALTVLRDGVQERQRLAADQESTASDRLAKAGQIEEAIRA
ncbi:MAG: HAMP domain-containing protein, partial [Beijerinckiaceae bacterium]